jgi:hypothetical protein
MRPFRLGSATVCGLLLACCSVTAVCQPPPQQLDSRSLSYSAHSSPLPVEQVAKKLQERNDQRAAALDRFKGTRVYRMEYHGFAGSRDAEMIVKVNFQAPHSKQFTIVSQSGSKFIVDHIFKKLLESEQDAASEENRRHTALSAENYNFTFADYESTPQGAQYVLNLLPKTSNKYLYRGKIWIDAKDFAVVRIEAEPAKNPSLWIKKTEVQHKYIKVDDFWLPSENHTESLLRMGGKAILSIEYKDYEVSRARPTQTSPSPESAHERSPEIEPPR